MGLFVSIFLLVVALLVYCSAKKVYHPVFLICILYGVILFFESFHLYEMYSSKERTYLIILVGVLAFCFWALIASRIKLKWTRDSEKTFCRYIINYKAYTLLLIVAIMMSIFPAINNLQSIANSELDFVMIRDNFGVYYDNHLLNLLYNYVVQPFTLSCLPISVFSLFDDIDNREKKRNLFLTIVFISLTVIMNAGRGIILYFATLLFLTYKMETQNDKGDILRIAKKRKYKRIVGGIFLVAIVAYIVITKVRGANSNSIVLRQIYVYLCGCIPHLDYRIDQIQSANICLYGMGGFHGLFEFIFTMLENFGIMTYPTIMTLSDTCYTNTLASIYIGPRMTFNAYTTMFYNCYLDGGIIAIIIEMSIYGFVCGTLYKKSITDPENLRCKLVLLFLLYGLCFSFIRFQFALSSYWIGILFLILLTNRVDSEKGRFLGESNSN